MAAHVRTECPGCGGSLKTILDLGTTPLADHFLAEHETTPFYPLRLAACMECRLCQLLDVVDDDELYGSDYGFVTSGSPALVGHYKQWAAWALDLFGQQAKRFTVDIGCNDGTLLRNFKAAGCQVLGVDPVTSPALCDAVQENGIQVASGSFGTKMARYICDTGGPAGLITGINVAAHVTDPVDFLQGVAHLLADDGVAVFEFGSLADMLASCSWDNVYHEHRFIYSLDSFMQLARIAGLGVRCTMRTPGQGGSYRVVLDKTSRVGPLPSPMTSWRMLDTLQDRVNFSKARLVGAVEAAAERGVLAGYGATAKSCTMLNFCQLGGDLIRYIEDATPSKIGKLSPGMRIPVTGPGQRERPDTFLLLAWNYLGPVLRREQNFLQAGGRFLVPYAVPVTI